jgi:hypothetical protein
MTKFTNITVKIADEREFNDVAEVLRGMNYTPYEDAHFSDWSLKYAKGNYHILGEEDGTYVIYEHNHNREVMSYHEFMAKYSVSPLSKDEVLLLREIIYNYKSTAGKL